MRLEDLQIDARPRSTLQAIDLGLRLWQRHARTILLAWWGVWLPSFIILATALWLLDAPFWLWLCLWWCKPLAERTTIHVLGRAVFGEQVRVRDCLRAWPADMRLGWLRNLSWWRVLVFARALYLPVWQLEGVSGEFAAQRRRALRGGNTGVMASFWAIICFGFEALLYLGLVSLLWLFFYSDIHPVVAVLLNLFTSIKIALPVPSLSWPALYLLVGGIIGPCYVAGCFGLYLNRRADLEGWDIEITLRKLSARQPRASKPNARPGSLLLAALSSLCLLFTTPAWADDAACAQLRKPDPEVEQREKPHSAEQQRLRQQIDQLDREQRGVTLVCATSWQLRDRPIKATDKDDNSLWERILKWLGEWIKGQASASQESTTSVLKYILIAALLLGIAWLVYRFRAPLLAMLQPRPAAREVAQELCGLDIRPESLPPDVASSAWQLWQQAQRRAALALLYRASLSRLAHAHAIDFQQGDTEGDCAWRVSQHRPQLPAELASLFTRLTSHWQAGAYGERWLDDAGMQQLCQSWRTHFGSAT